MRVSVIGTEEFCLGFELAGVNAAYHMQKEDAVREVEEVVADEEGVVIMEGGHMDALPERTRLDLQNSVDPVVIPVREEAESADLRKKIKQAIGVDLWSEG